MNDGKATQFRVIDLSSRQMNDLLHGYLILVLATSLILMANTKWRLSHELLDNAPFRNLGYCNLHPAILKKLVDWKYLHSRERGGPTFPFL